MSDETDNKTGDSFNYWGKLGCAWWQEAQKTTGATDQQTKFAACRHLGMTAVASAKASGYSGRGEDLRKSGSKAGQSAKVLALLALASAEGNTPEGPVTETEAKQILSALARGSDPVCRIRALDALGKMKAEEGNTAAHDYSDTLGNATRLARLFRDLLIEGGEHVATRILFAYRDASPMALGYCDLLLDVYAKGQSEPFFNQVLEYELAKHCEQMRQQFYDAINDPTYQGGLRVCVWGEIKQTPPLVPLPKEGTHLPFAVN